MQKNDNPALIKIKKSTGWMDGWMDRWMDRSPEVKAILRIVCSNQQIDKVYYNVISKTVQLTINIVNFEEKFDFIIWRLSSKLVHGINKLLKGNASIVILIKDVEHSLNKEGLKCKRG